MHNLSRYEKSQLRISNTKTPNTMDSICEGLKSLGILQGDIILVHTSLSSFGEIIGRQEAVVRALLKAVGCEGTVVMPAFTWENDDPANYENPPLSTEWQEIFRQHMLPFDKDTTPVYVPGLGVTCEYFRTYPGTLRSNHPYVSLAANGKHAQKIVRQHTLTPSQGMSTPLGALYKLDAKILLLGVGYGSCTAFHLSEALAGKLSKVQEHFVLTENGKRIWKTVEDYDYDGEDDFPDIGNAYEKNGDVTIGQIGLATCKLFGFKSAVDFGTNWIIKHRSFEEATSCI